MTRNFDWLLGAAFLAAPFYWGILILFGSSVTGETAPVTDPNRVLLLVFVYPVFEEIVFRGALQGWLRKKAWGVRHRYNITAANVLTSIIFAIFHLMQKSMIWSAAVVVPSLVFGFFRDRYGNLYAPVALHIFYNFGLVWQFLA